MAVKIIPSRSKQVKKCAALPAVIYTPVLFMFLILPYWSVLTTVWPPLNNDNISWPSWYCQAWKTDTNPPPSPTTHTHKQLLCPPSVVNYERSLTKNTHVLRETSRRQNHKKRRDEVSNHDDGAGHARREHPSERCHKYSGSQRIHNETSQYVLFGGAPHNGQYLAGGWLNS